MLPLTVLYNVLIAAGDMAGDGIFHQLAAIVKSLASLHQQRLACGNLQNVAVLGRRQLGGNGVFIAVNIFAALFQRTIQTFFKRV